MSLEIHVTILQYYYRFVVEFWPEKSMSFFGPVFSTEKAPALTFLSIYEHD